MPYNVYNPIALVMGDGVPCYGALEIVGLLLLLLLKICKLCRTKRLIADLKLLPLEFFCICISLVSG